LRVASELISKHGYDATSIADICTTAKISKGTFYYHFTSKQELFMVMIDEWLRMLKDGFEFSISSSANVAESLVDMAGKTGQIFEVAQSGFLIMIEFWRKASLEPELWAKAVEPYRNFLDYFKSLIAQGIEEGSLSNTIEPDIAARLLLSFAMGFILQASFDPQAVSWTDAMQAAMQQLLSGLRR